MEGWGDRGGRPSLRHRVGPFRAARAGAARAGDPHGAIEGLTRQSECWVQGKGHPSAAAGGVEAARGLPERLAGGGKEEIRWGSVD